MLFSALTVAQRTVSDLRQCHESLVDAEIRLVEAISEVDSLKEENAHITQAIAALENTVNQSRLREQAVKHQLKTVHDKAKRLLRSLSEEERAIMLEYSQLPTIEDLNNEIEAVNTRLQLMAEGNPHAVHAYENREKEIESKQQRLAQIAQDLETTRGQIGDIRGEWEPRLDELVATISDGFSHNFAQIGCAGQVGVHKDEDFEKWSIQIQVRFR
jgi:chromosome segregation ATPase